MTVDEAIKEMKQWALLSKSSNAKYCLSYLEAIPRVIDLAESYNKTAIEGLKIQIEYALSNATGWKGEIAKEAKAVLRKWLK